MACILWFRGRGFDVARTVAALSVAPYATWQQGELLATRHDRLATDSGLSIAASEAGFDSFQQQIVDVVAFIKTNKTDLLLLGDLARNLEAGRLYFDFGLYTRMFSVYTQVDALPTELLKLCGEIGAGITISQYPPDDESVEE